MVLMTTTTIDRLDTTTALQELANEILEEADYIEFPDHSGVGNSDWTKLSKASNPEHASNNCNAAADEVMKYTVTTIGLSPGLNISMAAIFFDDDSCHYANLITDDQDNVLGIIDFTARQFDASLPFPLVLDSIDNWALKINTAANLKFDITVTQTEKHSY